MDCLSASASPRPPQHPFGSQVSLCFRQPETSYPSLGQCNKTVINQSRDVHSQQSPPTQISANTQQLNVQHQTRQFPQAQTQLLLQPLPLHCSLLFPQGPWRRPPVPPSATQPAFFDPHYHSMQQLNLSHIHCRPSQAGVLGLLAGHSRDFVWAALDLHERLSLIRDIFRLDVIVVKNLAPCSYSATVLRFWLQI